MSSMISPSPVKMDAGDGDIPAKRWFQIRLPLSEFATASIHPFQARQLHSLHFGQGAADDKPRHVDHRRDQNRRQERRFAGRA